MREKRSAYRVLVGKKETDKLEDQGVNGRIILKWIYRNWFGGMDWVGLAQNKDRGRLL
jgi:hypothetical protein